MAKSSHMEIAVKIGELRNGLSSYLRKIRQGMEIAIFDRDKPVGRIVSYEKKPKVILWKMIPPSAGFDGLAPLFFAPLEKPIHAVKALLEDRRKR